MIITIDIDGTHLVSHTNMIICGKYCWVFADSGLKADVSAFSEEVGKMLNVPIVDALILYENLVTGEKFLLVIRNALYVPSINHNLLPPFVLREAGIECNNVTKIHCNPPTKDLHTIIDRESELHICLSIENTFSIFQSTKSTTDDVRDTGIPLVLISPEGSWDPSLSQYQQREQALIDYELLLVYKSFL